MPLAIRGLIDRITARPAANDRDARLDQIQRQIGMTERELQHRLRMVQERQDLKRRVPDV